NVTVPTSPTVAPVGLGAWDVHVQVDPTDTVHYTGPVQIELSTSDGIVTTKKYFTVTIANNGPTLFTNTTSNPTTDANPYSFQASSSPHTIYVNAVDADPNDSNVAITIAAPVSEALQVYNMDRDYAFFLSSSTYTNQLGHQEKRFKSQKDGKWYAVLLNNGLA